MCLKLMFKHSKSPLQPKFPRFSSVLTHKTFPINLHTGFTHITKVSNRGTLIRRHLFCFFVLLRGRERSVPWHCTHGKKTMWLKCKTLVLLNCECANSNWISSSLIFSCKRERFLYKQQIIRISV